MKFSMPNRSSADLLRKTDEIKVDYRDKARLFDYIDEYPLKEFVLTIPKEEEENIDFNELKAYKDKTCGKFSCELESLGKYLLFNQNQISFFWKYAASTFQELKGLKEIGVSQVLIDAPIFFEMDKVKEFGIPVRVIPNVAYDKYIPMQNGIAGSWFRPQDIPLYESYVTTIEFRAPHLSQIGTLFSLYAEKGKWVDNLRFLITNLDTDVLATGLPPEVMKARLNCKQKCTFSHRCRLCFSAIQMVNKLTQKHIEELKADN